MGCKHCQAQLKESEGRWKCFQCGSLQPKGSSLSHFEVLGLEATYFLNLQLLEKRFKELLKKLHPDRFVKKDFGQRRLSLEWTTALNDAYRELKDPLRRAEYILKWQEINIVEKKLDAEFLEEVLEKRQWLREAKLQKNSYAINDLVNQIKQKAEQKQIELVNIFQKWETAKDTSALSAAANTLNQLKYFHRFLEEAEVSEYPELWNEKGF